MTKLMRSARSVAIIGASATAFAAVPAMASPPSGYSLIWSDEFNQGAGAIPNQAVWGYDTGAGGWGNNELETYVNSQANCHIINDATATDGQALQIEVQTDTAGRYYSARINSAGGKHIGPYGYLEYRCQLPGGNATGIWPAAWTLGTVGGTWPYCGEIDIMEQVNGENINHGSLHAPGWDPTRTINIGGMTSAYHTYGAVWSQGSVTFMVDNQAYETQTSSGAPGGAWVFDNNPQFMIINLAVGGGFPGPPSSSTTIPSDLKVDYVRFYQYTGQTVPEAPFNGVIAIPGTLQVENYDVGGDGVSYHDSDTVNSGGQYRSDAVDIEACTDTGGGYDIGWTNAGEYMKYTVNVAQAGSYKVAIRAANGGTTNGTFHIEDNNGNNLSGAITVAPTGGWQTWATVNANVNLAGGQQVLKLVEDSSGFNLNSAVFTYNPPAEGPYNGTAASIPGTVQAENYDVGGEGVAYHDADAANQGGQYRTDGVDVETCTDTGGGFDIGWNAVGEYQKYTVNVASAGTYTVTFRVSNGATANGTFHLQNSSGTNLTGTVTIAPTGGWQTWTNVTANVTLPAGQQILQLSDDGSNYNINYMSFAAAAIAPSVPTGLNGTAGNTLVNLSWTASSTGTQPITYNVYSNGTLKKAGVTGTSTQITGLTNGTSYPFTVAAVNSAGTSGMSNQISLTPTAGSSEGPYPGPSPAAIPGTVQSENFDTGGEGVAYHDTEAANQGGQYRTADGVDIEACTDTGGGYNLGWNNAGEWQKYTVNVASAGTYTVTFRVANGATANGTFHLQNTTGTNLSGTVTVTPSGGWQTWKNVTANVTLPAGQQILQLVSDTGNYNINYMSFASQGGGLTPVVQIDAGSSSTVAPFSADVDFNSGNMFSGTNAINSSGVANAAPAAVYQTVRWNTAFNYTIPGLTAGATYTVRLHFAELTWTAAGQRKFNVTVNGNSWLSAFDIFATAGAQNKAVVQQTTATANASGQIVLAFSQGGADNPEVAGIEVLH